jgi:hypothetical protein
VAQIATIWTALAVDHQPCFSPRSVNSRINHRLSIPLHCPATMSPTL